MIEFRIVHVAPFYHPVIGGVEGVVKRIAEYLAYRDNEVHVLTYNRLRIGGVGSLSREETISNVHVVRLKPSIAWGHGAYSSELPEALRKLKPDVVHVHVWRHPHLFQVARLKDRVGFKTVLHGHAPFHKLSQLGLVTWLYHKTADRLMKGSLRRYDAVVTLTQHEKNVFTKRLGVRGVRVVTIPNGIDEGLIDSARNTSKPNSSVLYLGRISKSKNVTLLVRAMEHVEKEGAGLKLLMAGPDECLASTLRSYARKHGVNLDYLGVVSEKQKIHLYSRCSVFAHPAVYEPFGITLLEAQAFGKPCVITGDGGQLYAAPPNKTSLHADPNPRSLGEAIASLLSDEELYNKLSANAKKHAFQHSWSKILPKFDEVYGRICA